MAGLVESGAEGCGLAPVAGEGEVAHLVVALGQGLQDREALVRAAVIHEDHFPGAGQGAHGLGKLFEEPGEVFFLVEHGYDYGDALGVWHGRGIGNFRVGVNKR